MREEREEFNLVKGMYEKYVLTRVTLDNANSNLYNAKFAFDTAIKKLSEDNLEIKK